MGNPWDPGGARGSDWSQTPATNTDATATGAVNVDSEKQWIETFFGKAAANTYERLRSHGVDTDCLVGCLLTLLADVRGVSQETWDEFKLVAIELLDSTRYRPDTDDQKYAALSVCARLLFLKLAACLVRCAGLPLAAELFEHWLTSGVAGRSEQTETISLQLPDGATSQTSRTFLPLTWHELSDHIEAHSALHTGLRKSMDAFLRGICERLHAGDGEQQPPATVPFMTPGTSSPVADPPLDLPPSRNALREDGAAVLYTEQPVNYANEPNLITIGTTAILSELSVTAQRVYVDEVTPEPGREELVEVSSVESEQPDQHTYGYRIEIGAWRTRLWDVYDFDVGKRLDFLGIQIGDTFFNDLESSTPSCGGSLAQLQPRPYWLMSDTWLDVAASDYLDSLVLFLPDDARCDALDESTSPRSLYRVVIDGNRLEPRSAFG